MDSERVGSMLNAMYWSVLVLERRRYPLLTSDRPYVMTDGIDKHNGHIVIPISPTTVFISTRNQNTMRRIVEEFSDKKLRMDERLNDIVARQSHRFIYATDPQQLTFVTSRLGQKQISTPMESIIR